MIKSIELVNFQSHKNTKIDFHPNINIISGKSDSGKTAIIRSLDAIINNNNSDDFIFNGEKKYKIILCIGNNEVIRERSSSNNVYFLNGESYKSFRNDVPEDIIALLNFNECNLQKQLDSPFLLSLSPGEISRFFNHMVDISIIDHTISNIEKMRKEENRNIKNVNSQLSEYNLKLEKYENISIIKRKLDKLEKKYKKFNNLLEKSEKIGNLLEKIIKVDQDLKKYSNLSKISKKIVDLNNKYKKYDDLVDKHNNILMICNSLSKNAVELSNFPNISKIRSTIKTIKEKNNILYTLQESRKNLFPIVKRFKEIKKELKQIGYLLEEDTEKLKDLLPDICPICKKPINKKDFI